MTAITTSGGITIVAPQKAGGLLADVQYLEPYASSALNRKAYGIFGAGVYQGFSVVPGKGLNVIVKPNGTKPGVASVDINGYQITVQLLTEQAVALVAGKLNIVILEAKYGQGIVTDQVDANSKIKAASLRVVNDEKSILDGMVEVCRINLASNATSVPAESINVDKRFSLKVSYEPTDDINDARTTRLLTVKAGKSFVPLAGGDMTGPLGVTRLVFSDKITTQANTDIDRANGFTVESLSATSPGYPVQGGLGTLLTFKVNEYRNVQFALGSGNTDFYLRSMRKDNGTSTEKWDRVYTQAFKPTAADVGALTDAQAAQKYALRSIKINGKPLSSDVNLLAGDVNAYNKTEADGRYLAKTSNLADLTDKAKARGNLELGDAATRNVGVSGGQLMAVGAFGLGVGGRHFDDAYCNTAQIYRLNSSSANKPPITGNIAAGVISLPCDAAPSSGYLAISGLGIGYIGFSNKPENGVKWGQIYTSLNKPSAADVGALTDAQAAQKYALRSIKINGKPLSSDVNILASDVNAWNKTESDGRYLKLAGDTMKGRLIIDGATVLPTQPLRALGDSPALWMHGLSVSTLEFDDPNIKGYPTQPYSTLVNFSATEHRGLQLLSEKGTNNFWLRSADAGKYSQFVNIYHTGNKPSAADVGALTDAQAAQKYALRSIKVNGKPLTADVNLQAGDVNAYNKTESDSRYFARGMTGTSADVAWNAPSGFYNTQATGMTSVLHFHLGGVGSTRSADFRFNYGNGGIAYRSSRDGFGYEKGWTKIYTELDKPKPADIGTLDTAEITDNYGAIAKLKIDTGASATWVLIGTISNLVQYGGTLTIDIIGGSGYNASERNNATQRIMVRTNNNSVAKVNDPYRALVTSHHYGNPAITEVRAVEVSANKYEIYALVGAFTKNIVTTVTASVNLSNWAYSFAIQEKVPVASIRFIANTYYHTGNKPAAEDVGAWSKEESDARFLLLAGGTVKTLAIKPGGTASESEALRVEGAAHTPIVISRPTSQSNLSIGFQVADKSLMRLGLALDNELHWGAEANQASNPRIYTTAKPPTAQETGALTDAQAAQKYALRSIKVNGKPLSGDVNLLAGDVNAWSKTEADGRYLMKSGGQLTGSLKTSAEIQSTSVDSFRMVGGKFGAFWRNDGNNLYLLLTKANDQFGGFNDLRPLTVNNETGSIALGTQLNFNNPEFVRKSGINSYQSDGVNFNQTNGYILQGAGDQYAQSYFLETVGQYAALRWRVRGGNSDGWPEFRNDGSLYLSGNFPCIKNNSGTTWHPDGNIESNLWGGYLSNWLNNNLNGRVDWGSFNSRSHISGNRNAWWYKDELTGYIHQGGVINRGGGYLNRVNFPRGFTQDCFGVQITLAAHWSDSSSNLEAANVGPGGFDAGMNENERAAFWWAVGV
ncbi:hypothetical protein AI2795V1_4749 (plasmid) [Serratia marcescens]|uniref:phage tail fiber protein n=1 Tax=Serratia marcescens TaxID=615 RepID=UPI001DF58A54|nr:hypothetical protein [Serratia marcescens]CAE7798519.1 hypothetical protein AI2795V1_4749 [Serratia marcescens]CAH3933141.1 hypothetical protein AI2795V1_4749 [Serratia marcescens]